MIFFSKQTKQQHGFHMVTPSPWPMTTSFAMLAIATSAVIYLHMWSEAGLFNLHIALACFFFSIYRWFSDIITEATFQGNHTKVVSSGLKYGMLLFIVSEGMFFFSFFWAFFHSSLIPSIHIGAVWPPLGIETLNPWGLPFLNTLILISSGVSMTWAHRAMLSGNFRETALGLAVTISFGLLFTLLQVKEYMEAPFSMNDGMYGSIFFLSTGFHGFHVIMGTIFLSVCLASHLNYHFTREHHLGFEAAMWYWHFVDIVWILLFLAIYVWGS